MIQHLMALALLAAPAAAEPSPAITDPPIDAAHPAGIKAFIIPAQDGAMNAVLYRAAGEGPHPTLLLLHGFPGNEQNLDLAQAARRAGWNVLTLHYRGS
jgi:predicted alpha/beta-fold hydrolase